MSCSPLNLAEYVDCDQPGQSVAAEGNGTGASETADGVIVRMAGVEMEDVLYALKVCSSHTCVHRVVTLHDTPPKFALALAQDLLAPLDQTFSNVSGC